MAKWKPDARIVTTPLCGIVLLAACSRPARPSPAMSNPPQGALTKSQAAAAPGPSTDARPSAVPLDPIEPVVPGPLAVPPLPPALVAATPVYCPRLDLPKERDATCAGTEEALTRLAEALQPHPLSGLGAHSSCGSPWNAEIVASGLWGEPDYERLRDRQLARVEECAGVDAALVRLVRAWYWPDCADGLAEGALQGEHVIAPPLRVALRGYAIASKLGRLRFVPPWDRTLRGRAALEALRRQVSPWLNAQAEMLRAVQASVEALPRDSHGRAVAELALASRRDHLLSARVQPHDTDWDEKRALEAFYSELREIERPLHEESVRHLGAVLTAANIVADWTLLERWKNGWAESEASRGLGGLILPPLPEVPEHFTRDAALAVLLPPFVATKILPLERIDSNVLWGLVVRGFDPGLRRWSATRDFGATDSLLLAHARLVLSARALEPGHGMEAVRLLHPHLRVENAELLGALGAGLAQLPAREVRFAPVVVPDSLPLSALDAIASRAGASPVERALAAVDGSIVAFLRSPFYEGYLARAERTKQLMREAGPALAGCLALSNFTARGLCRCPTLGGSQ